MGLLQKIKTNFKPAEKKYFQPSVEAAQEIQANKNSCSLCGSNDWWEALGSPGQRRCWGCTPPPARALVVTHYFFDDAGRRWLVTDNSDGSETWDLELITDDLIV